MDKMIDFIYFIGVSLVKSQYKLDLHYSSNKEKTATQLRWHVLQDVTFPIYIPYFRLVFNLACLKQYLKANHPEYNERSAKLLTTLSAAMLIFLRDTIDIVGRFQGSYKKFQPFFKDFQGLFKDHIRFSRTTY